MQLWVGLGNPGPQYAMHRHNVGFMAVDTIAEVHGFGPVQKKFLGWLQEGRIGGEKILLLKPATFMNESGRAVGEALRFYKLGTGRADRLPRRARPRALQGQGEAGRRHRPGTTACARSTSTSAPISAACASASAIPGTRTG